MHKLMTPSEVSRERSQSTVAPTWLKVKSQIKAGDKQVGFGVSGSNGSPTTLPTWLRVKSQMKAGDKAFDFGASD